MWPRLWQRVFVVCLFVGMYVMVWCLVSVTRLDAQTVAHVSSIPDLVSGEGRQVPRNLAGLMTKTNTWPRRFKPKAKIDWCIPLSLRATPGSITALASFPGSGNTWLRYLLQQATGNATSPLFSGGCIHIATSMLWNLNIFYCRHFHREYIQRLCSIKEWVSCGEYL